MRLDEVEAMPFYHLASQLVYAGHRRQVSDVWIAGRRKLDAGTLVDVDLDSLRARAQRWQRFLAGNA
jgi:5-methylthioadenosine/S-adenosylhomocysteine deaminase